MNNDEELRYNQRLDHFLNMLKDEDPSQRWKSIEGIARIGDEKAVEPLIERLSDDDWRVRQKAAWALGVIGDQRAIVSLRHAMMRENMEGVKEIIMEALDRIKMMHR
jgi:HEAT repeat protein